MIGLLAGGLIKAGVAEKLARPLAIGGLIVLLVVGLGVAKCAYDANLIEDHDQAQRVESLERAREADRRAGAADVAAEARDAIQSERLEGAINNAIDQDPEAASRPVGPATGAALGELRNRAR